MRQSCDVANHRAIMENACFNEISTFVHSLEFYIDKELMEEIVLEHICQRISDIFTTFHCVLFDLMTQPAEPNQEDPGFI